MLSSGWDNRTVRYLALFAVLLLSGCTKNIDNKEAVQDGVRKGVAKRGIDVNQMDVNVTNVAFHGGTADATVSFAAKGGPSNAPITVNYQLERIKDEWVIKGRTPMNTLGHTQGSELPGEGSGRGATGNLATSPDGHLMPNNAGKQPMDKGYGTMTDSSGTAEVPPGHAATRNTPSSTPGQGAKPGPKQ